MDYSHEMLRLRLKSGKWRAFVFRELRGTKYSLTRIPTTNRTFQLIIGYCILGNPVVYVGLRLPTKHKYLTFMLVISVLEREHKTDKTITTASLKIIGFINKPSKNDSFRKFI